MKNLLKKLTMSTAEYSVNVDKRVVDIIQEMREAGIYPTDATAFNKLYSIIERVVKEDK